MCIADRHERMLLSEWGRGIAGTSFLLLSDCTASTAPSKHSMCTRSEENPFLCFSTNWTVSHNHIFFIIQQHTTILQCKTKFIYDVYESISISYLFYCIVYSFTIIIPLSFDCCDEDISLFAGQVKEILILIPRKHKHNPFKPETENLCCWGGN